MILKSNAVEQCVRPCFLRIGDASGRCRPPPLRLVCMKKYVDISKRCTCRCCFYNIAAPVFEDCDLYGGVGADDPVCPYKNDIILKNHGISERHFKYTYIRVEENAMKLYVITAKKLLGNVLIAAALMAVIGFNYSQTKTVFNDEASRKLPIYNVQCEDKVCAVSFDAAWGNEDTHDLVEILKKYDVKATFFVVGDWVEKYPESVKELSDAGHDIMNHSDTHPHMTQISKDKMLSEVNACDEKIEKITGKKPNLFRPPYGDYNDTVVETLKQAGHFTIQWDVDTLATVGNPLGIRLCKA